MATPNHKARSRPSPSGNTHPTAHLSPHRPDKAMAEDSQQQRIAALAGIAFANQTIACLLDDASTLRDAHQKGISVDSVSAHVLAETVHGLFTATYFLNQYAETLMRESSG